MALNAAQEAPSALDQRRPLSGHERHVGPSQESRKASIINDLPMSFVVAEHQQVAVSNNNGRSLVTCSAPFFRVVGSAVATLSRRRAAGSRK